MDWVAFGTLVAVSIGAVAGVWTARETRQLAKLQKAASDFPDPAITAMVVRTYEQTPEVANVRITIRNRADIAMELVAITSPRTTGFRFMRSVRTLMGQANGETGDASNPGSWPRSVSAPFGVAPASDTKRNTMIVEIVVHRRPPKFPRLFPPVINLEMRWRDHAVTRFSRQITVTPASTA